MHFTTTFGPIALYLAAALSPLNAQSAKLHPNATYITSVPRSVSVAFGTRTQGAPTVGQGTLMGTIGQEDGPPESLLGRVKQATLLDDTTVAILDQTGQDIRLFSVKGRHLGTIGRKGEGPGEFRAPQAIVQSPSGDLLISDIRQNIQIFRRGPRGYEYQKTWSLPFSPRSMCFLGQRLFVSAPTWEDSTIIHELNSDGTIRRSFGSVYRSPNAVINYEIGQGRVACDARRQLIYFMAGSVIGDVRAFRPTGEALWRVQVSDFRSNIIKEHPDGMTVARDPLGAHAGAGLSLVEGVGLLAMWTFSTADQIKAKAAPLQTQIVLIDPATGKALSVGTELSAIQDVRGSVRLEFSEEPFPKIDVRRMSSRWPAP